MNDKEKRISLKIELPSIRLKNFIEKALKDDEFFEMAIENPINAFKENGININTKTLTPSDLANFFGALAGAKELVKKKNIKDIKFENIFGEPAEIIGATIISDTERAICTNFRRDAFSDIRTLTGVKINFVTAKDLTNLILRDGRKPLLREFYTEASMAGRQEQSRSREEGVTFHFDANQGVGSKRESSIDTYRSESFSGIGKFDEVSMIEQIFNGPLINPVDLINISAQINAFTNIIEKM
jgi:hypothetical protein